MVFEFVVKCKDNENNFSLNILIDENQSFLDFHNAIQLYSSFESAQITSFFISDDEWNKNEEITLLEMNSNIQTMENSKISDFLQKKGDKAIYLFDFFSDRFFKIELVNILNKTNKKNLPTCTQVKGNTPKQIIIDSDLDYLLDEDSDSKSEYDDENINFKNIDDIDI